MQHLLPEELQVQGRVNLSKLSKYVAGLSAGSRHRTLSLFVRPPPPSWDRDRVTSVCQSPDSFRLVLAGCRCWSRPTRRRLWPTSPCSTILEPRAERAWSSTCRARSRCVWCGGGLSCLLLLLLAADWPGLIAWGGEMSRRCTWCPSRRTTCTSGTCCAWSRTSSSWWW